MSTFLLSDLPGERKRVTLVALAGERIVYGGNGRIDGQLDEDGRQQAALGKQKNGTLLRID